ncbi:MAG: 30S ribosomal protein S2 [Chloroflexi bacterium]|nr:30S ribosomal protein S2 [Chloroflexota bacterium]
MAAVSMKMLLESGVHFGHQTRRWNPKMRPFIFTERNGIHIIDLQQTVRRLDEAMAWVKELAADGGRILFVGTKKQAQDSIREEATRASMPYVNQRWLGGMLTNFQTIRTRIRRLEELEQRKDAGEFEHLPKKEAIHLEDQAERLNKLLGGIRSLERLPDALFVVDPSREHIAIAEAVRLEIPIVSMVDTNCEPGPIAYPIPSNDDAIRAIRLITGRIADAASEGTQIREASTAVAEGAPEDEADEAEEIAAVAADVTAAAEEAFLPAEDRAEVTPSDAAATRP